MHETRDAKFGFEIARISAIFSGNRLRAIVSPSRHRDNGHFLNLRQWLGGAKNGASDQHWPRQMYEYFMSLEPESAKNGRVPQQPWFKLMYSYCKIYCFNKNKILLDAVYSNISSTCRLEKETLG